MRTLRLPIIVSLFLFFTLIPAPAAEEGFDAKLLAAFEGVEASTKRTKTAQDQDLAVDRLRGILPDAAPPLQDATWSTIAKRMPPVLKQLEVEHRIRLLLWFAYRAPERLQDAALTWRGEALDAGLDVIKNGKDPRTVNLMPSLGALLPRRDEAPVYLHNAQHHLWQERWERALPTIYEPRIKKLTAVIRKWQPADESELTHGITKLVQQHPVCTPVVKALIERLCDGKAADESLQDGFHVLRICVEPLPAGPQLVEKYVARFAKDDLSLAVNSLLLWRGDQRIGAALYPLMEKPGEGFNFARAVKLAESQPEQDPWKVVLPPAAQRAKLVDTLVSGLASGLKTRDATSLSALRRFDHVMAFPEAYAGMLTPPLRKRLETILAGEDDFARLVAFNLLGHLAGPAAIDTVYAEVLPAVHDLLLPDVQRVQEQRLRGTQEEMGRYRIGQVLAETRARLTLCRLPITGEDRFRLWAWRNWRSDFDLPAAAWLVRTTPAGAPPLLGTDGRPAPKLPWLWPTWADPDLPERSRPEPDWQNDLAKGMLHLRDFPEWSAGAAVIDTALKNRKETDRLMHLLTYGRTTREGRALRAALRTHAGLRAFAEEQTAAWVKETALKRKLTEKGPDLVDPYELSHVWGDALGEPRKAADLMALRMLGRQDISLSLADLARWAPDHPFLDTLQAAWSSEAPGEPLRPFQSWCLQVLRGRDPGPFPEPSWRHRLVFSTSDDSFRVIEENPERFIPHLDALRSPCLANLTLATTLARMTAVVQAAGDGSRP